MSTGRKRTTDRLYSAEDQALDQISKEAEERSHERRKARAEAREIRLKEIERQQKEEEECQKDQQQGTGVDPSKSASSYSGSRRGSDDSTDTDISTKDSKDPKNQAREMKHKLKELEEKYKAAMVTNAQLDNIKTSHVFQIELLKEQIEEQEETMLEVQREYKDKCREYELLKRDFENVKLENESIKRHMEIKDKLLKESGLVILVSEEGEFSLTKCGELSKVPVSEIGMALLSEDVADALKKTGDGSLGKIDYTGNVVPHGDVEVKIPNLYNSVENNRVSTLETKNKADVTDIDNRVAANNITNTEACISCITDTKLDGGNDNKVEVTNLEVCGNDLEVTDYQLDLVIKVNDVKGIDKGDFSNAENAIHEEKIELLEVKEVHGTNEGEFLKGEIDLLKTKEEKVCKDSSELEVCYYVESVSDEDAKINMEERMFMNACIEKEIEQNNDEDVTLENVSSSSNIGEMVESRENIDECNVRFIFENKNNTGAMNIDTYSCVDQANDEVDFRVDSRVVKDRLPFTASYISMESDITYHSESSDIDSEYRSGLLSIDLDLKDISSMNVEPEGSENTQVSSEHVSVTAEESEEIRIHQSDSVLSSEGLKKDDEVFLSVSDNPLTASFSTGDVESFARSYVKDVIQKSIDKVHVEGIDENVMMKNQSLSSSDDNNIIAKRLYSQELVKIAVPFFSRSLSAGSVQILGPVSLAEDGSKYFNYKVDTSIQEENNPLKDNNLESSTISGYGVCYLSNFESDAETGALLSPSEDQISLDFGLGFLPQGDAILPEIIPMPVKFLNKRTINAKENIVDRDSHDVLIEEMSKENRGVKLDSIEHERMYSAESNEAEALFANNVAAAQACEFIDDYTSQIHDLQAKPEGVVNDPSFNVAGDIELSVNKADHVNECSLNNAIAVSELCAKDEVVTGEGSNMEDSGELLGNDEIRAVELTAVDATDKSIMSLDNTVDITTFSSSENETVESSIETMLVEAATDSIKNDITDNAVPEIQDGENVTDDSKSVSNTVQEDQQQEANSCNVQCDSSVLPLEHVATEPDKPKSMPEVVEQENKGVEMAATNTNGDTGGISSEKKIGQEEAKQEQVTSHGESQAEVMASSHLESAAVNSASFEGGSLNRKKSKKKSSKDKKESKEKDDCLLS